MPKESTSNNSQPESSASQESSAWATWACALLAIDGAANFISGVAETNVPRASLGVAEAVVALMGYLKRDNSSLWTVVACALSGLEGVEGFISGVTEASLLKATAGVVESAVALMGYLKTKRPSYLYLKEE